MQRIVLLTEGFTEPGTAKTASSVLRYRRESVVAILDRTEAGRTAEELLETGGDVPVVASLDEIDSADTLVLGIAPPGGRLPESWRPIILAAISRGMNIVNGLHHFLV
ncbi:MAG: putative NAD-dependent epimerase/dehydratase family protein, partial [Pirellulaceae bacterium]